MQSKDTKVAIYRDIVFEFIRKEDLFDINAKILLAVSGGRDSMTLLDILSSRMKRTGLAHVNFRLRDESADKDERFVERLADKRSIPTYMKRVEQSEWADLSENTQAAAREIRYRFFDEIAEEHGYDYVATGHHLTDALETMIFQAMRGTGIHGIRGIPLLRGKIVRPLLCLSRDQIDDYVSARALRYREDLTNEGLKYTRNRIRHLVLPEIRNIFPGWEKGYRKTYTHLSESVAVFELGMERLKDQAIVETDHRWILDKDFIRESVAPLTLLWVILKPFGFHPDQCEQMLEQEQSGRMFHAGTFELIEERKRWILRVERPGERETGNIPDISPEIKTDWGTFYLDRTDDPSPDGDGIKVDLGKIDFPLTVRSRSEGDRFQPLGMSGGIKRMKKFLIDEKIPLTEKDLIPLLINGNGDIIWVCGYRMDERYKITDETEQILRIRWTPPAAE